MGFAIYSRMKATPLAALWIWITWTLVSPSVSFGQDLYGVPTSPSAPQISWISSDRECEPSSFSATGTVLQAVSPKTSATHLELAEASESRVGEQALALFYEKHPHLRERLEVDAQALSKALGRRILGNLAKANASTAAKVSSELQLTGAFEAGVRGGVQVVLRDPAGKAAQTLVVTSIAPGLLGCAPGQERGFRLTAGSADERVSLFLEAGSDQVRFLKESGPEARYALQVVPANPVRLSDLLKASRTKQDRIANASVYRRTSQADRAHGYVAFDGRDAFKRGQHVGTQLAPDGTLQLAEGAKEGVWVSEVLPMEKSFNSLTTGIVGRSPRGSRSRVMVRSFHQNQPSRWRRADRNRETQFRKIGQALQIMVLLLARAIDANPSLGRVTFTPSVYGLYPQGPRAGGSFPRRRRGGNSLGPSYRPRARPLPKPSSGTNVASFPQNMGSLRLITRAEWKAEAPRSNRRKQTPKSIIVHHTATKTDLFQGHKSILSIQNYHRNQKGWNDIGYHFLIGPQGELYEGVPVNQVGTHAGPSNQDSIAICLVGHFSQERPHPQALATLQALTRNLVRTHSISAGEITGHKDHKKKDCPGESIYSLLPQLRASVGGR